MKYIPDPENVKSAAKENKPRKNEYQITRNQKDQEALDVLLDSLVYFYVKTIHDGLEAKIDKRYFEGLDASTKEYLDISIGIFINDYPTNIYELLTRFEFENLAQQAQPLSRINVLELHIIKEFFSLCHQSDIEAIIELVSCFAGEQKDDLLQKLQTLPNYVDTTTTSKPEEPYKSDVKADLSQEELEELLHGGSKDE